jgi:hypothetical protein
MMELGHSTSIEDRMSGLFATEPIFLILHDFDYLPRFFSVS